MNASVMEDFVEHAEGPAKMLYMSDANSVSARVVEANLGAQTMTEDVTLRAFLGPPDNLQPTFEIFGQGYTPLGEQLVLSASALGARPPYGEELVMSIPPIPTLPSESEASIVSFSPRASLVGPM